MTLTLEQMQPRCGNADCLVCRELAKVHKDGGILHLDKKLVDVFNTLIHPHRYFLRPFLPYRGAGCVFCAEVTLVKSNRKLK